MKKIALILILLSSGTFAFSQKEDAVKKEIDGLERQRFEAQVKKDFTFLEKIFAEDLIYTHSSGKTDTKATYIASIREGKSVYEKIDVESIGVRVYNNAQTALVNGVVLINLGMVEGKPNIVHLRYSVAYIKDKAKGWQLANWQSGKLAN